MQFTPYHAKYFAHELTKRSSSDSVQKLASTLVDAQVDLNPHQVEAALFAFRSPLSKGAILADEVGLGKTIEAGLVISQKWAERKRKILIISPANLRKQWSQELQDKFFLPSAILEAKSFNENIKRANLNPFDQKEIVLCSYEFAAAKEPYVKQIKWDLVVIDEAHRLRNIYQPGETRSTRAKKVKQAVDHCPKVLLTATPLQNSLLELYGLVSIIDEYAFGDLKSFKQQYSRVNSSSDASAFLELKERLKPMCKRTLRRQVLEYIRYTNRIALVEEFYPSADEQRLYDLVSEYLQQDNLYALPSSQRKLMTLILRRLLASSTYAISGTLEALARKLENMVTAQETEGLEEELEINYETFEELKDEWADEEEEAALLPVLSEQDIHYIKKEIVSLREFEALAKSIKVNSKGEKLFTALERGFQELGRLGAPRKAMIFTESTRTQEYLRSILESRGFAGKVVLFNGSNNDAKSREIYTNWLARHTGTDRVSGSRTADIRAALVDYFREEATIMIATEAAAEGINLQFCSFLVNFDLPWNPQRIEQRIGRCHRYGQKYDVVVVNFLNKANAADQRVYELLRDKFNLFNGVFGASDEVLGSIESGVDFEKRIARIYQDCRTTEQIETAFNELQAELEGQITDTMKQTRQNLLENFDAEVHEKLRINLRESQEYLSKYENWLWGITQYFLKDDAVFADNEHSFSLRRNPFPDTTIHPGPYRIGRDKTEANIYRISHPLAQRIIEECKGLDLPQKQLVLDYDGGPKISILEPLRGQEGWLLARCLTVSTFETEDYVLLTGLTDSGQELDSELCHRLFSLPASEAANEMAVPEVAKQSLTEAAEKQKKQVLGEVAERNGAWFQDEMEKLEAWAEDLKVGLEREIKDLDAELKLRKAEAKKTVNLEEKVAAQRLIKDLESKRSQKRRHLFEAQDEVDQKKETLLSNIEERLNQTVEAKELFLVRWKII